MYHMLKKLRDELIVKANKTNDEEALLKELISLNKILDIELYSLAVSGNNCPTCGRPLSK